ncbi:MAG: HGGxSTG domain-containing protein [Methyloceanibacter sp.]
MSMYTLAAKLLLVWSNPRGVGSRSKLRINPMQSRLPMHLSPRCGAKTRNGTRCKSPAMNNGRCRMHGGKSTGAPKENKNALKHGRYSAGERTRKRSLSELLRVMKALARP